MYEAAGRLADVASAAPNPIVHFGCCHFFEASGNRVAPSAVEVGGLIEDRRDDWAVFVHEGLFGIIVRRGEGGDALATVVGAVGEIDQAVVVASGIVHDLLAHDVGVPLDLGIEVLAQLDVTKRLELALPDGPELNVGSFEMTDVLHDLDPATLGVDGHEAVVAIAKLFVWHCDCGAVRLQVFDGFEGVGDDPAHVVDGRAVFGEPIAFVFELVRRRFELHLERTTAGEECVVDATFAGVVHVVGSLPVVGRDRVVPLEPVPHCVARFGLVDAEVMQLIGRCRHADSLSMIDPIWVNTHNRHVARVSETTKVEHRQRLLDAAAAEFAAKGLDGARIDDISLAAGLAKGTIYNYFDSKLDVFRAVVGEWARRSAHAREPLPGDASIRDHLHAITVADMAAVEQMEEFARTTFRVVLSASAEVVEQLLPAWDPVDAALVAVIERAQNQGELRADRTPAELARIYTTLVNGLLLEHWTPGSSVRLTDIADLAVDYYLDGARS